MVEIHILKRCPRFSGASPNAIAWLSQRVSRKYYEKRAPLFAEGDPALKLFLIERGAVKVFKTLESGRELILNIFRSGESVGEVALIDKECFPASASAQDDSFILELSQGDYVEMGKLYPEVLYSTIRDLNQRVKAMTQRIHELASGSVEARLAQVFLSLSRLGKPVDGAVRLPCPMSRQELADMIGVRIETVIRVMSRWHKDEIIVTEKNGFLIPNLDTLQKIKT